VTEASSAGQVDRASQWTTELDPPCSSVGRGRAPRDVLWTPPLPPTAVAAPAAAAASVSVAAVVPPAASAAKNNAHWLYWHCNDSV